MNKLLHFKAEENWISINNRKLLMQTYVVQEFNNQQFTPLANIHRKYGLFCRKLYLILYFGILFFEVFRNGINNVNICHSFITVIELRQLSGLW